MVAIATLDQPPIKSLDPLLAVANETES